MKTIFVLLVSLFFVTYRALAVENVSQLSAAPLEFGTITVHIKELKNSEGMLAVSLHNSKKGFPGKYEEAYSNQLKKITNTEETIIFEHIPYGTYAVSIMHDENSNGKMDKYFIGIPKEGFGISNNPKIGIGGPKYSNSEFTLNTSLLDLTIVMKYL